MRPGILSLILLFICLHNPGHAITTVVSGNAPGAAGQMARLITYTDLITFSTLEIASSKISDHGVFELKADLAEITQAYIRIGFYMADIYLKPGETYVIITDTLHFEGEFRPFYNPEPLNYRLINPDDPELNYRISLYNAFYDGFVMENAEKVLKSRNRTLTDTLRNRSAGFITESTPPYIRDHITYKTASFDLMAGRSRKTLFLEYLHERPILYHHPEYMKFFNDYFARFITGASRSIPMEDLISTINEQNSLPALTDSLGKDTLLRNEVLRELVLLKGLRECYYNPDLKEENVLGLIGEIGRVSKFPMHRVLAGNIVKELTWLRPGSGVPDFTLPDLEGKSHSLSEFRGDYVYLGFFTLRSSGCLFEMDSLAKLTARFADSIRFVSVSLDDDPEVLKDYVNKKRLGGVILLNNTGYKLAETYNIKTFPLFLLLDGEGRIMQNPAIKPTENIQSFFRTILSRNKQ